MKKKNQFLCFCFCLFSFDEFLQVCARKVRLVAELTGATESSRFRNSSSLFEQSELHAFASWLSCSEDDELIGAGGAVTLSSLIFEHRLLSLAMSQLMLLRCGTDAIDIGVSHETVCRNGLNGLAPLRLVTIDFDYFSFLQFERKFRERWFTCDSVRTVWSFRLSAPPID